MQQNQENKIHCYPVYTKELKFPLAKSKWFPPTLMKGKLYEYETHLSAKCSKEITFVLLNPSLPQVSGPAPIQV